MASLQNVTAKQKTEFERVLVKAGMDSELFTSIASQPRLAAEMVDHLREQMAVSWLFSSLGVQLANVVRWNRERDWGFTDTDFAALDLRTTWHADLVVDVIVPFLPDRGATSGVQRTFDELWAVAAAGHAKAWRWDQLRSGKKHLSLIGGIEHTPGLRRVTVNLGANWDRRKGTRPEDIRGNNSAHAEVLAAAAHFPQWVQAMDGFTVPYVWLPGYMVALPWDGVWRSTPTLSRDPQDEEMRLRASADDLRDRAWACPTVNRR